MGLVGKLKKAGAAVKDASAAYAGYTVAGARDVIPTTGTVKGAAHGDIGDIAKIAGTAAVVFGGARLARSATTLRTESAEARLLAFPETNPARSLAGRVKNAMNDKRALDRAERAFSATRQQELPGKIAKVKQQIAMTERYNPSAASEVADLKKPITIRSKPGERGALRFPAGSPEKVQKAHAAVPEGQMLFTVEQHPSEGMDVMAFTRKGPAAPSVEREAAMERQVRDVGSKRAKLAGFYEKIQHGEEGWIRARNVATAPHPSGGVMPAHTEITFGEGTYAKAAKAGGGKPIDQYRAVIRGGSKPEAIKVDYLSRTGKPGNVTRELSALSKSIKAQGVTTIEHQPLTDSRSRLFARMLKGSGLKNADKGVPLLTRRPHKVKPALGQWR